MGNRTISGFSVNRIGVTGTDTGVGKTVVTTSIVSALRHVGRQVAAMKPIETGDGDDAERLREATGNLYPLDLVRPLALPEPLAPLVAAQRAGIPIDLSAIDHAFQSLQGSSDTVVVEGAGGLLVPITATENFATLFKRWDLELVIVAANRLGVLNHTLLTLESARVYGLPVRAIVLNTVHAGTPTVSEQTNHGILQELAGPIPVLPFPYLPGVHTASQLAEAGRPIVDVVFHRP